MIRHNPRVFLLGWLCIFLVTASSWRCLNTYGRQGVILENASNKQRNSNVLACNQLLEQVALESDYLNNLKVPNAKLATSPVLVVLARDLASAFTNQGSSQAILKVNGVVAFSENGYPGAQESLAGWSYRVNGYGE